MIWVILLDRDDSRRERAISRILQTIREQSTRVLGRQDERNVIYVRELEVYLKLKGQVWWCLPAVLTRINGESWLIPSGWLSDRLKFVRELLPFALLKTARKRENVNSTLIRFYTALTCGVSSEGIDKSVYSGIKHIGTTFSNRLQYR